MCIRDRLAGPIVRAGLFFGELFNWRPPGPEDFTYGLARASFGLVKKTVIADQFASVANAYFDGIASHPGAPAAWSALFAFSMQIYFDFSGYSDIAIGCARMLGFVFPENFRMPYLATSITDFWHRWHITLSTWLRDYLYVPLGGNRHGSLATLRNLMITMLLGGLWHLSLIHIFLVRSAPHQYAGRLFEIEEPERQIQVLDIEHVGEIAKCRGVLVVRIEQNDVRVRLVVKNRRQNQRNGARLSRSARAHYRKVP